MIKLRKEKGGFVLTLNGKALYRCSDKYTALHVLAELTAYVERYGREGLREKLEEILEDI